MKLDSRIIEGKKPLDCFDVNTARQFIGKKGYFGLHASQFMDLDLCPKCVVDELKKIDEYDNSPFKSTGGCCYSYFLPIEWLKEPEKKYRPFTGIEFAEKFNLKLNSIIHLRTVPANDKCCYNYKVVFAGYRWDNNDVFEVFLNGWWVGLQDLLRRYEYEENGEWHKFGVEE